MVLWLTAQWLTDTTQTPARPAHSFTHTSGAHPHCIMSKELHACGVTRAMYAGMLHGTGAATKGWCHGPGPGLSAFGFKNPTFRTLNPEP